MKIMLDNLPESRIMISTGNKNNRIRLGGDLRSEQKIMKKHDIFKKIGLGLAISALAACQASAIVAYNTPTGANVDASGVQNSGGPYILGSPVHGKSAIRVTGIGAFNFSGTGANVDASGVQNSGGPYILGNEFN